MKPIDPDVVIGFIRESFQDAAFVYTNGSCFEFYKILKSIFPQAEAWWNVDHVWTEIDGVWYDITGRREEGSDGLTLMKIDQRAYERANEWKHRSLWRIRYPTTNQRKD